MREEKKDEEEGELILEVPGTKIDQKKGGEKRRKKSSSTSSSMEKVSFFGKMEDGRGGDTRP